MLPEDKFFQTNDKKKIWQRYCGFLDLSIDEFMEIQERLLMEQIALVSDSILGKKILGGKKPKSIEEFRSTIPLTTYNDYEPYLTEQREDALSEKPLFWCHSTGRGGAFKWIPYTIRAMEVVTKLSIAEFIMASAHSKGEINFYPGYRTFIMFPSQEYISGALVSHLNNQISIKIIPPMNTLDTFTFQERIALGFRMSLGTGLDLIGSMSSVLVKMGEAMAEQAHGINLSKDILRPLTLSRLISAFICSRIARRPILPKDIWKVKAVCSGGVDTSIYQEKIAYYWGQPPYDTYAATEMFPIAMQCWNKKWMTLPPDCAFFEFIPEDERLKNKKTPEYPPRTVLLNEVEAGKTYELVLTHFYGMPLLRYRIRDLVTFVELHDAEAGINLPQLTFKARCEEIIPLAGLAQIDEKTIWQAIENAGLRNEGWTACKEYDNNQGYLRIYIELKQLAEATEVANLIDKQLKIIDVDYRDIDRMLGFNPVRVTLLSTGTFQRFYNEKLKEGVNLVNLKPPHVNVSESTIQRLVKLSSS